MKAIVTVICKKMSLTYKKFMKKFSDLSPSHKLGLHENLTFILIKNLTFELYTELKYLNK